MFIAPEARSTTRRVPVIFGSQVSKGGAAARKPKPDPLVKLLADFRTITDRCRKAVDVMNEAQKRLIKDDAEHPNIYPNNVLENDIDVRIMTGWSSFSTLHRIRDVIKREQRTMKHEIGVTRAAAKRPGPMQTENKLHLIRLRAQLTRLPDIQEKLLTALAKEKRRVDRLQRSVKWDQKVMAYAEAYRDLWKTFEKMEKAEIKTHEGALALMAMTVTILCGNLMRPEQLPLILDRAHRFLSERP